MLRDAEEVGAVNRSRNQTGLAVAIAWALLVCAAPGAAAAQLQKRTIEAFDSYVKQAEGRMDAEVKAGRPFLWVDALSSNEQASSYSRLRNGEVLVKEIAAGDDLPGGLVHDWVAVAFIPNATVANALAELQDYNNDAKVYAPEVLRSKLLQRSDGQFLVFMRVKKKSFVTVVMDMTNDIRYFELDRTRAYSRSYTTRIVEIEEADTPKERQRPEGDDHGYLWRLYTYWRLQEKDGGVYVQCRAVALTRGIPYGLGWLVKPFVTKIPRESLLFTMTKARDAIREEARNPRTAMKRAHR